MSLSLVKFDDNYLDKWLEIYFVLCFLLLESSVTFLLRLFPSNIYKEFQRIQWTYISMKWVYKLNVKNYFKSKYHKSSDY